MADENTEPSNDGATQVVAEKPSKVVTIRGISIGIAKIKAVTLDGKSLVLALTDGAKAVVPPEEVAGALAKLEAAGVPKLPEVNKSEVNKSAVKKPETVTE